MKAILLEIDHQIEKAEAYLLENAVTMDTETRKKLEKMIADLRRIRMNITHKWEKLDNLFELMMRV